MGPKKGKDAKDKKKEAEAAKAKAAGGAPPKPKKIPPPPACFKPEDIMVYKQLFKEFDEDNIDKVKIEAIPTMLRKLGFNPKPAEIQLLFEKFLEDDLVDTVELHEFYFMIEAKMVMGDDFEIVLVRAMQALGHDDEETGFCLLEVLRDELMTWGNPFKEEEFVDWLKLCIKDKTYNVEDGSFNYGKFIENMNNKDMRFFKEPINYFKLDQKTLAAMAIQKAQEEKAEQEKKEAERLAREEAKRQKLIAAGLVQVEE